MVSLPEVFIQIEEDKNSHEFMKTGFNSLDELLDGGFLRKELIVLGAFTGIGKSYLAGQLMINIAREGFKCAYFSLEISNAMIVSRMLGSLSNLKPTRIQTGLLTPEEFQEKARAKAKLSVSSKNMYFYDDLYDLSEISKEIKEQGYEFVVIDFIQNVMSKGEEEYSRLTKVSLELQRLAKHANCTILALSQLSNSAAREGNGSKTLEYKGSGAIAMVCDLGFFLERVPGENGSNIQSVKLNLRKNRRGVSGYTFDLFFQAPGGYLYE